MTDSRKIALDILYDVFYKNSYSNIVLNNTLNKYDLKDVDRGLVTEIVYGTIKYKYSIDKILSNFLKNDINKTDKEILNILRIGIYQIRYLDKVPNFAAVNECVELAKEKSKKASGLVNGVLRNYIRRKDEDFFKGNEVERLCFEYSFPKWMVDLFLKQYGIEYTEKILEGLNSKPNVNVRVNNLKSNYEEIWDRLIENNYNVKEGAICPEAIDIIKGKSIENNPLFKDGYITVQDESAMLVAPSMELQEDMIVLDLCSAPGGKTTHISEIMNNTGKVMAFDLHENKLSLIKNNMNRLGITNISLNVMDATIYNDNLKDMAQRVLIDVPCSGLGIIRKKPEIKYTKQTQSLKSLIKIQRKILENASAYVKKDGILLYSTCTLNKEENEENIKWFLDKYKEFKIEPIYFGNMSNLIYNDGVVTILPNENMDGFFIARLRKQW
ncbi:16S rRNA (cytosine(967)-C(5))-methyltransferase RsmB [uncultured Clostridium sp.]|uniref:16S rRNA (cytosine(967)-C(5))-methyltransferase RsmB n=1 Tax=uncultured Clostridium sp. TaxID=59620 RepID=UPI0028E2FE76|nr:16S rRNA (cytosine(967)-C(5))-methyltransferase RsmB [uncultured Clostridium sp.]